MEHSPKVDAGLVKVLKNAVRPFWRSALVFHLRVWLFEYASQLTNYRQERQSFKEKVGYDLNLEQPRSLNEKIIWKKINDRNPLLVSTSDKYAVRSYVVEALGREEGERILVPLHAVADDPSELPFDTLPDEYIIKTNHDSGGNLIVRAGEKINVPEVIAKFRKLLREPYGVFKHEWAYSQIKSRKVMVERLLRGGDGDLAQDYKFHVFHGVCRFIHTTPKVNGVRTGKRSLFTPAWEHLPVGWKHPQGPYVPPPPHLKEMIAIAEKLATPFDYVRVDLYDADGRIYFGELTHYHGSGTEKFLPSEFDFEAGKWWEAIPRYWVRGRLGPNRFVENLREYPLASHRAWELADKSKVLKLDWNESDLTPPDTVIKPVVEFITKGKTQWYPDIANRALTERIASYAGVPNACVLYFGGEDSALEYAVRTFVSPGDEVGLVAPTYDNFRVYVESVGAAPVFLRTKSLFEPDLAGLQAQISPRMRMVYLVNPNNPTGTLYAPEDIKTLLTKFPGVYFIVDEAYIEFGGASVASLVEAHKNLIVGRSFSKAFGLASFRMGYLVSEPENLIQINKIRNGKAITTTGQIAALAALEHPEYMQAYVREVQEARALTCDRLAGLGIETRDTPGNFILVKVGNSRAWCSALAERQVFVRNLDHLAGMEEYVRITVGRRETMTIFLEVVRDLMSHGKLGSA